MNRDLTDVLFYHVDIPRTASRSIRTALGLKNNFWMHLSARQKRERADYWDRAWTFSVVRNPYSKLVSQFKHRQTFHGRPLDSKTFAEWVTRRYAFGERPRTPDTDYFERLWWPQWRFLTDESGDVIVDDIYRFESLSTAWEEIQSKLDIDVTLPHENAAEDRSPWQEFYGEGAAPIIRGHFEDDFERWEYNYDIGSC